MVKRTALAGRAIVPITVDDPGAQNCEATRLPLRKAGKQSIFFALVAVSLLAGRCAVGQTTGVRWFVNCSRTAPGDGSEAAPWNSLAAAQAHRFAAGDRIALARGTVCDGSFSLPNCRLAAVTFGMEVDIIRRCITHPVFNNSCFQRAGKPGHHPDQMTESDETRLRQLVYVGSSRAKSHLTILSRNA